MCLLEGERGNRRYFEAACSGVLIQGRQPSLQSSILGCRLWRLRKSGFKQVFAKCDYECARDSLGTPAKGGTPVSLFRSKPSQTSSRHPRVAAALRLEPHQGESRRISVFLSLRNDPVAVVFLLLLRNGPKRHLRLRFRCLWLPSP